MTRNTEWMDEPCPQCGSTLLTNGRFVWCSYVGHRVRKRCDYGINTWVTVEDFKAGRAEAKRKEAKP